MNLSYLISKWFLGLPPAPLSTFLLQKVLMTRGTHSVMMGASYKDGEREIGNLQYKHFLLIVYNLHKTAAEMG